MPILIAALWVMAKNENYFVRNFANGTTINFSFFLRIFIF